jgi:hypothetical protein
MPHMLAQEHMGYVDALRYGTARTEATLAAALSGIGASFATLVLTMTGDGVWTLNSNVSVPGNITLWIPAGVTVHRAAGVTLFVSGQIVSWSSPWETGPGATVRGPAATSATEFSRVNSYFGVNVPLDGPCFIGGPPPTAGGTGRQVIVFSNDGGARTGIRMLNANQDDAHIWDIGVTFGGGLSIRRPAHVHDHLTLTDAGFGIGDGFTPNAPVARLHSLLDNTLKATSLWGVPSDERLKTVLGDFTEGLATLCALPQSVRFKWNGQGSTIADDVVHYGRIAQETLPIAPFLITTYQAKLEPEDAETTELYAANDSPLLEMLINAVKELAARVEALEGATLRRSDTASPAAPEEAREPRRRGRRA